MSDTAPEPRVDGEAIVYRLFDVGYAISLDRAFDRLASSGPERRRPTRGEAQTIRIPNPPVTVSLGREAVTIGGHEVAAEVSARLFDFGVVSMRAKVRTPDGLDWESFAHWGAELGGVAWTELLAGARDTLLARLGDAVEQPRLFPGTEDYTVFRVNRLFDADGGALAPATLTTDHVARLLIGERRALTAEAKAELLSPRLGYFADDLVVLTWGNALVVEPEPDDTDVQYVLEFANAQLLELRWYDAVLEAEVPTIQLRFLQARQGFRFIGRRYNRLLERLQRLVADSVELMERLENSLRVTDDVYLARVYSAALEEFRERSWRSGIERKVAIVREAYDMLNAESLARRSETLEIAIVLLIMFEIALTLLRH
ncbi:MAG: hypothetical protein ACKO3S_08170 [bacterium]